MQHSLAQPGMHHTLAQLASNVSEFLQTIRGEHVEGWVENAMHLSSQCGYADLYTIRLKSGGLCNCGMELSPYDSQAIPKIGSYVMIHLVNGRVCDGQYNHMEETEYSHSIQHRFRGHDYQRIRDIRVIGE